ncbi:MAG: 16S rRNA (uracil(1498)-N(3))-methyltransferase [Inquilinus sp.]|nr:16S rRNA (uracil(1498)-N(3))-methyltransferase [Inquilinus sp.]
MAAETPRARLFVDVPLAAARPVPLAAAQAHYLRAVLRLAPGRRVALFNGVDGEWLARLTALDRRGGSAEPLARRREQTASGDLWLCFAPLKKSATDFVLAKATELGAAVLQPVLTRRTEAARVNLERYRAATVEAAEQCERLDVPAVREPVPLARLLADWPAERALLVCAERGPAMPIAEAAARLAGRPAAILIGPEGGLAQSELDGLGELPFVHGVSLGARILRADTAAAAALACWQAIAGDWRERPPDRGDGPSEGAADTAP